MNYILLHGLGQTSSSWDETIQTLNEEWNIFCPNLSDWILGKQPCYDTLYKVFENYCEQFDVSELNILDFQECDILSWLAELMKHRDADTGRRYKVLAPGFIEKYQISTEEYDVIKGWRANASYFYIAKCFVRDEVDLDILPELLKLGDLGIQYCLKTEKAFLSLKEDVTALQEIDYHKINPRYTQRDRNARESMYALINSEKNKIENVFSKLL